MSYVGFPFHLISADDDQLSPLYDRLAQASELMPVDLVPFGASGPVVNNQYHIRASFANAVCYVGPASSNTFHYLGKLFNIPLFNRAQGADDGVWQSSYHPLVIFLDGKIMITIVPGVDVSPTDYPRHARFIASLLAGRDDDLPSLRRGSVRERRDWVGSVTGLRDHVEQMFIVVNSFIATQFLGVMLPDVVAHLRRYIDEQDDFRTGFEVMLRDLQKGIGSINK